MINWLVYKASPKTYHTGVSYGSKIAFVDDEQTAIDIAENKSNDDYESFYTVVQLHWFEDAPECNEYDPFYCFNDGIQIW